MSLKNNAWLSGWLAKRWFQWKRAIKPSQDTLPPSQAPHEPSLVDDAQRETGLCLEAGLLLPAIRDATREAERWHAIPQTAQVEEALEQVRQLRELHASLKLLDRQLGVRRDRLALAMRMRDA